MRDLASVVTVEKVWPLEGKDRVIGCSFVENGYEAMVGKDTKPGQLVAFIQEGAILPVKEEWEFLRKRCYKDAVNGFVIKPLKFATIRSWGLVVPLNDIEELHDKLDKLKAGDDLTDILEIRKYEPEEDASPKKGESKKAYPKWVKFCLSHVLTRWIGKIWQKNHQNSGGGFPSERISKSDETTLQNNKSVIEKYADEEVVITAKIEGQSFTVDTIFKGKKLIGAYPCSRNNAYKLKCNNLFWEMMEKYDVINKMKKIYKETGKTYILQGEQVGPGIQDNIYDFKYNQWFLYTVKDGETLKQLSYEEMVHVADKFGMNVVPLLKVGKLKDIIPTLEAGVTLAENAIWEPINDEKIHSHFIDENTQGAMWKDYFQHEGVVVRTSNYDKDNNIGCSFKIKNLDYASHTRPKIHTECVAYKTANLKK